MEKLCYVVWKRKGVSDVEFRDELIGETAKQLLERRAHKLSVLAADEATAPLVSSRITSMANCGYSDTIW